MPSALDLLKEAEGYRQHPYKCTAGKWTVGYGRNLDDVGISPAEAEWLLERDIQKAVEALRLEPYWLDLSETRQAVLIDMCVNMGWPRFSGFQKMRAALRAGNYQEAAAQMEQSAWFHQVKLRGVRNVNLMRSGD